MDNFDLKKYLTESRLLKEEAIFADFRSGVEGGSLLEKFARTLSEELHTFGAQSNMTIDDLYRTGEMEIFKDGDPEGFYASKVESLEAYQSLPPVFTVNNNIEGNETFTITKNKDGSFSATKVEKE
tara:strand:+ start:264 stop:641 length:378 start_codon:yes stop_codon:yes gene_type:complete